MKTGFKERLSLLVQEAFDKYIDKEGINTEGINFPRKILEQPKSPDHGDYASNLALILAKPARRPPRKIGEEVAEILLDTDTEDLLLSVEVAGPGFINMRVNPEKCFRAIGSVYEQKESFGKSSVGSGKKVNVEYISANPTGPLHVGHARGAVTGDVCASLLSWAGYDVVKEYYVNDFGNQVDTLASTVHVRYRQLFGEDTNLPPDSYPADYVIDIARELIERDGKKWLGFSEEEWKEPIREFAVASMLRLIKDDLASFNIEFDIFSSERRLHHEGLVGQCLKVFEEKDLIYEAEEGGRLFRSTSFGDDKDRALLKKDGKYTYFAGDIGYHLDKMNRGFDRLVNVWGADHAGHIARMKAGIKALGGSPDMLDVIIVQIVHLTRGGTPVRMGKRTGDFVTLSDVIREVGRDATRILFITRKSDAQLEFDIELAKSTSMENPVYYLQYGHARICAILEKARREGLSIPEKAPSDTVLKALVLPEEKEIAKKILDFPDVIEGAAEALEPHRVVFYLHDTIGMFHTYYTRYKCTERVISDDPVKSEARLYLIAALGQVIRNGLLVLGVDAPERMDRESEKVGNNNSAINNPEI